MRHFRTPESIKAKLDVMEKQIGADNICLDHGVGAYQYSHYVYTNANYSNKWTSQITIYFVDFDLNKTVRPFITVTANDLRKPNKNDWYVDLVSCYWEKEFPSLLCIKEYTVK